MPNMEQSVKQAKENCGKIILKYLAENFRDPPKNHIELVYLLREKADKDELWLLGALEDHITHQGFQEWVMGVLVDSGLYKKQGNDKVVVA